MRVSPAVVALSLLAACSADRAGLGGQDLGVAPDFGGPTDFGVGVDHPVTPPADMFVAPPVDMSVPPPDMFVPPPDMFVPPPDMFAPPDRPPCMPSCSSDGAAVVLCSPSGALVTMPCDRGCDPVTRDCRPPVFCTFGTAAMTAGGTTHVNLCGAGNDHDRRVGGDCSPSASGEDVVVRLEVPVRRNYRIDLGDASGGYHVDPMVYVRTVCNDPATELACDDDGGSSTDSSLTITLDPGEYFIVVDSYDGDPLGTGCGDVDLTVTAL